MCSCAYVHVEEEKENGALKYRKKVSRTKLQETCPKVGRVSRLNWRHIRVDLAILFSCSRREAQFYTSQNSME